MQRAARMVRTSVLEIAYEESGPRDGAPIILVHGWPDNVRTWDAVIPALVETGYRCLAPFGAGGRTDAFFGPCDASQRPGDRARAGCPRLRGRLGFGRLYTRWP